MTRRKSFGFIALLFVMAMYSCGEDTDSSTKTYGPVGPTESGYFFTLTVSPTVLNDLATGYFNAKVVDGNGLPVANVPVIFAGFADDNIYTATGADGYAHGGVTVELSPGFIVYVTVRVENKSITGTIQII